MHKTRRLQTLGEEIGNSITHGVMALFAICAAVLMYLKCNTTREYIGVTIFSVCMLLLYTMSCLYHSFKNGSKVKRVFRIFDHLSIFLLIGGTYAPVLLVTIYDINQVIAITTILCCLLGWSGLVLLPILYNYNIIFFYYILAGGITYMLGIIFYALTFKYAHFVWHFFCIGGTILHFVAIYLYVL